MEKKVSICIPVFNGEKTIKRTILSAASQTYGNIEILVIDNCSEDRTKEVVESISDRRIVFLQNETNLGMAGNWNQCIIKSTGDYIHFLCADDVITPDCIRKKVSVMERYPDVVMVTSATDLVDEDDNYILTRKRYEKNVILDGYGYARKSFRKGNIFGEPSNILFRKSDIEKTGMFSMDLHYTTDWELWVKISVLGKIAYLKDALTQYRLSSGNATSTMKLKKIFKDDEELIKRLMVCENLEMSRADACFMRSMLVVKDICRMTFLRMFPLIVKIRRGLSL